MALVDQEKERRPGKPKIPGFRTDNRTLQTRFHFHMDLCVGCHACEVACAEQNGLSANALWRRVGEVEAGTFPESRNYFISSGCNHCLDAPCVKGCPADAYQVNGRGIVIHLDEACIGCQYCTWNCPYGVPVYQKDRRIVTKCDMCTHRLDEGLDPACVQACPAGAIEIETVPLSQVLEQYRQDGAGPGMPSPEISLPSTKITLPEGLGGEEFKKVDRHFVRPQEPHLSLVWMTVLTQLGLGGVAAVFLSDLVRTIWAMPLVGEWLMGGLAPFAIGIASLSLAASVLHLGRPAYAHRALKNWRTSWLSREVLGLGLFAGVAVLYAALLLATEGMGWLAAADTGGAGMRLLLGGLAVLSGTAGVYCSSRLYRVPARPAWDTLKTTADFFLVALILGMGSFALAVGAQALFREEYSPFLGSCAQVAALLAGTTLALKEALHASTLRRWETGGVFELETCARLYREPCGRARLLKNLCVVAALATLWPVVCGAVRPGTGEYLAAAATGLLALLVCCLLQRYLFFVTVVPRNTPGNFLMAAHRTV